MSSAIPDLIRDNLEHKIGLVRSFSPVSGGCINNGGRVEVKSESFFLKWNDATKFPGMFGAEAKGLRLLSEANCIRVPSIVLHDQVGNLQFIVMEWIESSRPNKNYWDDLGRNLASLHSNTEQRFGLDHDNFIGSLQQSNRWTNDWSEFFIRERLEPQLDRLNGSSRMRKQFESLFKKLPGTFPTEQPSLLHGDLWQGNLITDEKGNPCVIDPAIYFGHREMELSFTKLFGGFDQRFYDTYKEVFPLESGFDERIDVCNLYPLLVHANLFGGHYLSEIEDILRRWA